MYYLSVVSQGLLTTIWLTFSGFAIGSVLGFLIALVRREELRGIDQILKWYTDVVRSVPTIVWLFLVFYAIGTEMFAISRYPAAVATLSLVASAHMAENFRSGFKSISPGQAEAAIALGLSKASVNRKVLVPQALRVSIPPAATFAVGLLKESAILSIIGIKDITFYAVDEVQRTLDGIQLYGSAAILYIAISLPIAFVARYVEKTLRLRAVN